MSSPISLEEMAQSLSLDSMADWFEEKFDFPPNFGLIPSPTLKPNDALGAESLSDEPWVKSAKGKPLPGRGFSSREVYEALLAAGGSKSATARALRLSTRTLRRRLEKDDELRTLWECVAPHYQKRKAVVVSQGRGPRFLRLCTPAEISHFVMQLRQLSH